MIDTCVECGTRLLSGQPDFMGSHSMLSDCVQGLKAKVAKLERALDEEAKNGVWPEREYLDGK